MLEQKRFEKYLDYLRATGKKDATLEAYRSSHREFCRFLSAQNAVAPDLARVTGLDIRSWKSALLAQSKAPATINARLIAIKAYADWAHMQRMLSRQQIDTIKAVPEVQMPQLGAKVLDPDSFRRFLRAVELQATARDRAIVYLLLSGLRISEVAGLRAADIELNAHRGSLYIRGEHVKRSAYRQVPLSRQARVYLAEHLKVTTPDGIVFHGERGAMTTDGIYKVVAKYGQMSGVDIHPHLLRHHFSRGYLDANQNDIVGLQLLLGHAQLETTARYYARKRFEDLEAGVEKVAM